MILTRCYKTSFFNIYKHKGLMIIVKTKHKLSSNMSTSTN